MTIKIQLYLFIAAILSFLIIDQMLISNLLMEQKTDGTIINYAGRQRMLSQNIAKNIIIIQNKEIDNLAHHEERRNLNQLLGDFTKSHNGLKERDKTLGFGGRNSEVIEGLFKDIQPSYEVIVENARRLSSTKDIANIKVYSSTIMNNEQAFLTRMDNIVFQYNKEYDKKLSTVTTIHLILIVVTVVLLIFGGLYLGRQLKEK